MGDTLRQTGAFMPALSWWPAYPTKRALQCSVDGHILHRRLFISVSPTPDVQRYLGLRTFRFCALTNKTT